MAKGTTNDQLLQAVNGLRSELTQMGLEIKAVREEQRELTLAVKGDSTIGVKGLVPRVQDQDDRLTRREEEASGQKKFLAGVAATCSLIGVLIGWVTSVLLATTASAEPTPPPYAEHRAK